MAIIDYTTYTLKLDMVFVDEDTRSITLKNPKATITSQDIAQLNSFIQSNNALIGDKDGATFGRIKKATRITQVTSKIEVGE